MGLVDKILNSFIEWVNLEVEDFGDTETDTMRGIYQLAMQQHASTIAAHQQAQAFTQFNLTNLLAMAMDNDVNKARIMAKKAESKAKEQYNEHIQKHNAKKCH